MDGDVGQGALVGLFSPVWRLCPFVPRDVLVLVFWWGWSQGEGFYTVEGDGVFPGPVGQDVYARVSRYGEKDVFELCPRSFDVFLQVL